MSYCLNTFDPIGNMDASRFVCQKKINHIMVIPSELTHMHELMQCNRFKVLIITVTAM